MESPLVLQLAERRVHHFGEESIPPESRVEACERFLQKGIDAYKWLRRAEEFLREADYEGLLNLDATLRNALGTLYEEWLKSSNHAKRCIETAARTGEILSNRDEFMQAYQDALDIVEQREWQSVASRSRVLSTAEEPW
jgi:hypothetical protein